MNDKKIVGAVELCDLPKLMITDLNVRVDTGAATSSLHVDNIEEFEKGEELWITFDIHPDIHNVDRVVRREAKVEGQKRVKSYGNQREALCYHYANRHGWLSMGYSAHSYR